MKARSNYRLSIQISPLINLIQTTDYVYTCMYICMHVCMYLEKSGRVWSYTYACMYTCMDGWMDGCMHA